MRGGKNFLHLYADFFFLAFRFNILYLSVKINPALKIITLIIIIIIFLSGQTSKISRDQIIISPTVFYIFQVLNS